MVAKVCPTCKEEKPPSEFYKDKEHEAGLSWQCKVCASKRHKECNKQPEIAERRRRVSRAFYREYPERQVKASAVWRKKNPLQYWASASLAGHKRKGFEVNLNSKELAEIIKNTKTCNICGIDLEFGSRSKLSMDSPTVDRIDNGKKITKDSVWLLCHRCNTTKLDRSLDEFVEYCKMVVDKFGEEAGLL